MSNFTIIRPVGTVLKNADGQTERWMNRHDEDTGNFSRQSDSS